MPLFLAGTYRAVASVTRSRPRAAGTRRAGPMAIVGAPSALASSTRHVRRSAAQAKTARLLWSAGRFTKREMANPGVSLDAGICSGLRNSGHGAAELATKLRQKRRRLRVVESHRRHQLAGAAVKRHRHLVRSALVVTVPVVVGNAPRDRARCRLQRATVDECTAGTIAEAHLQHRILRLDGLRRFLPELDRVGDADGSVQECLAVGRRNAVDGLA